MDPLSIALTLAVGVLGGGVAHRCGLAGGTIIGALVAVASLHLAVPDLTSLGPVLRTVAQLGIGGASDMAAAALQLDADVGAIAAIHVVRQVVVFVLLVGAFIHYLTPEEPHAHHVRRHRRPRRVRQRAVSE